jgi:hypothetical protein
MAMRHGELTWESLIGSVTFTLLASPLRVSARGTSMHRILNFVDSVISWFRPPAAVVIEFRQGRIHLRRGNVPRSTLEGMSQVLKLNGVVTASIWGYKRRDTVALAFSREIPESVRQQLRNVWNNQ